MNYVIIGASAAGISAAETIRKIDKISDITILSEDEMVYSRCMLHHVISGKRSLESISFISTTFFTDNAIKWIKGVHVINVDVKQQVATLHDGRSISYDRLLIATGSKAAIPPIKGFENASNVFTLRNISDVQRIIGASKSAQSALIIGAGLVGLDAAVGLMERGIKVSIVEKADRILPLQLDATAAGNYHKLFEHHGARVYTGVAVSEASNQNGHITHVTLSNGEHIQCDLIVVAAGVKPVVDFLSENSVKINKGILVDSRMQTSVPTLFAAGDVTGLSGIWPNAVKQGIVAACNMAGKEKHLDDYFTAKNTVSLLGLETVALGIAEAPDPSYTETIQSSSEHYKKIIHKDGIIYGTILQKDIGRCGFWTYLIKEKVDTRFLHKKVENLSYADFFNIRNDGNFTYSPNVNQSVTV